MMLAGLAEAADILGVTKQVVTNWRNRRHDFPKPMQLLKQGPIWDVRDIYTYRENMPQPKNRK